MIFACHDYHDVLSLVGMFENFLNNSIIYTIQNDTAEISIKRYKKN